MATPFARNVASGPLSGAALPRHLSLGMSRFVNLEFEGDSDHDFQSGEKAPVKDES